MRGLSLVHHRLWILAGARSGLNPFPLKRHRSIHSNEGLLPIPDHRWVVDCSQLPRCIVFAVRVQAHNSSTTTLGRHPSSHHTAERVQSMLWGPTQWVQLRCAWNCASPWSWLPLVATSPRVSVREQPAAPEQYHISNSRLRGSRLGSRGVHREGILYRLMDLDLAMHVAVGSCVGMAIVPGAGWGASSWGVLGKAFG